MLSHQGALLQRDYSGFAPLHTITETEHTLSALHSIPLTDTRLLQARIRGVTDAGEYSVNPQSEYLSHLHFAYSPTTRTHTTEIVLARVSATYVHHIF